MIDFTMFELLARQPDAFHLLFGLIATLIGAFLLKISRAHRAGRLPDPLPNHLRFLQGEGMPQLVAVAAWLALLGGLLLVLAALALLFG
jgi:hypothetical protein